MVYTKKNVQSITKFYDSFPFKVSLMWKKVLQYKENNGEGNIIFLT